MRRCLMLPMLAVALATPVHAQQPSPPSSTAAQAALKKGLAAVQQKQWAAAIGHFSEAHKAAPAWPDAMFDLGLAEAQVSGRELRAIGWLEAYLALVPEARNAAAVRGQILDLDKRAEVKARAMTDLVKAVAAGLPKDSQSAGGYSIVALLGMLGDVAACQSIIDQAPAEQKNSYRGGVIDALIEGGRTTDAQKMIESFPPDNNTYRDAAYHSLAKAHIEAGRFAEADLALQSVREKTSAYFYLPAFELVVAQHKNGQMERAAALLQQIKSEIEKIAGVTRNNSLALLAATEGRIGNLTTANTRLSQLKTMAPTLSQAADRKYVYSELAYASYKLNRRQDATMYMKEAEAADDKCMKAKEMDWSCGPNSTMPNSLFNILLAIEDWPAARARLRKIRPEKGADLAREWEVVELAKAIRRAAQVRASRKIRFGTSAAERAQGFSDYVTNVLNTPLFTDHAKALADLGKYSPKSAEYRSMSIFNHVNDAAKDFAGRLALLRQLRS